MKTTRNIVPLVTFALTLASGSSALAADTFSFPSANGATVAAMPTPHFAPIDAKPDAPASTPLAISGIADERAPLAFANPAYKERFGMHTQRADGTAYTLLTSALASQSFANYAADYYRLFTPGYAVTAWTERVYGMVDIGYGGSIDGWTAGAYYLGKVRGPSTRRNSPPDLSTMPTFRAHPELQEKPVFSKD